MPGRFWGDHRGIIQAQTALMYAATKETDRPLALKCLARMEQQLATAVRVREFIQKGRDAQGTNIAEILSSARRRLAASRPEEKATAEDIIA